VARVDELLNAHTEKEIARILNDEGIRPVTASPSTPSP